ncbi:formimidoylglutamase [Maribacter sp. PR1]|uniref:Formimidoylglutamase n=1 Tax=Maribacter cobaltidurans TaxID=1178778 RepID=A0ABU7IQQ0_9FLAO|nr:MULTISPECIES: formimidoylglutamase [Maribacter]MDC6387494.1 formimidoylglutamase [Maribacter sp. PR1]MEE1974881.1 formimidoylglutamase [Maribacter cobaltidurans]
MSDYSETLNSLYSGRKSEKELYLHEKISCTTPTSLDIETISRAFAILGYSCEEGVKRNQGRIGTAKGPDAIRQQLGRLPNHLKNDCKIYDVGSVYCTGGDLEKTQEHLTETLTEIMDKNHFPIVLGGGHDMAYGTYTGLKKHLNKTKSIGIINFDAHFDLRNNEVEDNQVPSNSGTPFFQIAQDCTIDDSPFKYLCLGIRKDANDRTLFETAKNLGVQYIMRDTFRIQFHNEINAWINAFTNSVDHVYVTIDLDGFSSAYAPGVSAPSPMGFTPDVVLESLKTIMGSGKLKALDIAELNPDFDVDNQTAKLAASLVHYVIHNLP